MLRRVNLIGGPGVAKSSFASYLFCEMKKRHMNVELAQEWVKQWSYEEVEIKPFDQLYIFASQLRKEEVMLRNGVDIIISDSPVYLPVCYSIKYGFEPWKSLIEIVNWYDKTYSPLNIFLDRKNIIYDEKGRWETYEEALKMDNLIIDVLENNLKVDYKVVDAIDWEGNFELILNAI